MWNHTESTTACANGAAAVVGEIAGTLVTQEQAA
jgi:hypothetical protein